MTLWRLLDTGIKSAEENIALDSALLEAKAKGLSKNTIRFLQFNPPCALIGFHQTIEHEIRTDFCRENGIDINRRITGGGAIYFDTTQLGWEVIASRVDFGNTNIQGLTEKICNAAALGLKMIGINAEFRPRNDIEVNGKKISGTGGVFDGDAFLYQGTILVDFDAEAMLKALRIPTEKLTAKGLNSAKDRVTSIKDEFGMNQNGSYLGYLPSLDEIKDALASGFAEAFSIKLEKDGLTDAELTLYNKKIDCFKSKKWIYSVQEPSDKMQILSSVYKKDGGLIRANLKVDLQRQIVRQALITGDFFITPSRFILDLEAALKDASVESVITITENLFDKMKPEMLQLSKYDFIDSIRLAIEKLSYQKFGISLSDAGSLFLAGKSLNESLKEVGALLLPYCAKPPECDYRNIDGCSKCGLCSVGDAYKMAEEKGLKPITITNYEHLKNTLHSLKGDGVKSYIGCCCEAFFIKRHEAFEEAGIPGVLIDIENKTCYELKKEEAAYKGGFQEKTEIKIELLKKMLEIKE
jgi:lipoate-protein ligase A